MINELYELSNHRLYSIQYLGHNAATYSKLPEEIIKARQNAINRIQPFKNLEGLIGYCLLDEPGPEIAHSLMNTTFRIRKDDPNHFVYTAVNQRYSLNRIKEGLDVIGTDCYPATTSDALHCVSTVAIEGIRNMANAKANWGIIQIYDKTVDGESGQTAPTELELRNMLYQVIAAGAMGLFAFDYASLWYPGHHNPPQKEWEKAVKIFSEFKNTYAKFVYAVEEPFRESYYFPEMIYSIPRGENVVARIWKDGNYDYILLVNMDKSKQEVTYKFRRPSNKTCLEIMSGAQVSDLILDDTFNVILKMSYIGVVWLRGYDSDKVCTKVNIVDPSNLPDYFVNPDTSDISEPTSTPIPDSSEGHDNTDNTDTSNSSESLNPESNSSTTLIVSITAGSIIILVIIGIIIFLWIKKKSCFAPKLDITDIPNENLVK